MILAMFPLFTAKLQNKIAVKCPLDLQLGGNVVDLMEVLKIHQANFISLVENQYIPVSYLPAAYPGRSAGVDEG